MFDILLPRAFDNVHRGAKPALWIFALLILLYGTIGVNSTFNPARTAVNADGIPLSAYPPAAAQTIVSEFALLGLSRLVLAALGLLVLLRYRSMVPLMLTMFLLEFLARRVVLGLLTLPRTGAPPANIVNAVILTLIVAGLVSSMWRRNASVASAPMVRS